MSTHESLVNEIGGVLAIPIGIAGLFEKQNAVTQQTHQPKGDIYEEPYLITRLDRRIVRRTVVRERRIAA